MKHQDVRKAFTSHFEGLNHRHVESSSLVPFNDPTLLFTNAGMNQFKNIFLGTENVDYNRAVSIQKCVRAGGKHNDLENVGYTTRHHTFFEMLGNFSFGDYFKKDAIHFAWDLLTNKLSLPKDKLYVTVFETDDEAADIWHKQEGVPRDRIVRYGEKDNFWRMGDTGPCGPCSEIFYDHGPSAGNPNAKFGEDDNRYVEIWNLVFMQYFEDGSGKLSLLPKPSVDTGAGLERVTAVMQGKADNYQTDLFAPLIKTTCQIAGLDDSQWEVDAQTKATCKVIADHARATCFLMGDGVFPSNEGRGYVLRRIMRRALRYAQKISNQQNLFQLVCATCLQEMSPYYPALEQHKNKILKEVEQETTKFLSTLSHGTQILEEQLHQLRRSSKTIVDGKTAFKLYDTFGFPLDLTQLIAREQGFQVNVNDFTAEMEKARQKAKAARKTNSISSNDQHLAEWSKDVFARSGKTEFVGYTSMVAAQEKPLAMSNGETAVQELKEGQSGFVIFKKTPFYAESGGQAGDDGEITDGLTVADVFDCTKLNDVFIHQVMVKSGVLKVDAAYNLNVKVSSRRATAKNHSATHLLNSALRQVLGTHVAQAGSQVTADKLRFDFKHPQAVTADELSHIEDLVNEQIVLGVAAQTQLQKYEDAVKAGAIAMAGEKYSEDVRVLSLGEFSKELCGGTHVANTADIGVFKIVSESSVSAGVRRIEGLTGATAIQYLKKNTLENIQARKMAALPTQWEAYLEAESSQRVEDWMVSTQSQLQTLKKQVASLQTKSIDPKQLIATAKKVESSKGANELLIVELGLDDRAILNDVADKVRDCSQNLVFVIIGAGEPRPLLVGGHKSMTKVHCGELLKRMTQALGGKGGGRPDFAQGSVEKVDLQQIENICREFLK